MDSVAISVTLLTTSATLLLTIVLFVLGWLLRERAARLETRRRLISRVLDAVDSATRKSSNPIRLAPRAELDYALVIPRLFVELRPKDRAIAEWASRQVQLMLVAPSDVAAARVGYGIGTELAKWHHRERTVAWFEEQVRQDPPITDFHVPISSKWRRNASRSIRSFKIGLSGGVAILAFVPAARELIRVLR